MSNKNFLPLPTGNNDFTDIRAKNRYYVDKSPYLKTVFSEEIREISEVMSYFKYVEKNRSLYYNIYIK